MCMLTVDVDVDAEVEVDVEGPFLAALSRYGGVSSEGLLPNLKNRRFFKNLVWDCKPCANRDQ